MAFAQSVRRFFRHLVLDRWAVRATFPQRTMDAIEAAIAAEEARHDGELRFAVEACLPLGDLFAGGTAHARAIDVFTRLRVWDTEQNAGVLIYLLLADRRVEVVADRGIDRKVGHAAWEAICGAMQREFAAGRFEAGAIAGVRAISDLLATHVPPRPVNPDELPNRPVVL
ncbi:MAG: TPM domain-containing protein [Burkholderiales bacterium]|nr:TPM domain-containing protein [Burkholderiales bacterium]